MILALLLMSSMATGDGVPDLDTHWPAWLTTDQLKREVPQWLAMKPGQIPQSVSEMLPDKRARVGKHAGDLYELWARTGDADAWQRAITMVDTLLRDWDAQQIELIDPAGGRNSTANIRARDAALELALRYALQGDPGDAEESGAILLRFSEAIPEWTLWDRQGNPHSQNEPEYFSQNRWDASGVWSDWYHLDLTEAFPLLRAYDLIHTQLPQEQREQIVSGVFAHHMNLVQKWDVGYTNVLGSRINGIIHFGLVLQNPDYIHEAVRLIRQTYRMGYFADGTWKEVSPDYSKMMTLRFIDWFPPMLAGYSDPAGYTNAIDGQRFDNLNLQEELAIQNQRMMSALDAMVLPNNRVLAINDSEPKSANWGSPSPSASAPRLLGVSGHAVLGFGEGDKQQQLRLNFHGTNNHEHHDRLHLTWFAHGQEVFSETAYRGVSGSDREWHKSTAGHNTVMIDGAQQHTRFRGNVIAGFDQDDEQFGMIRWRYRDLGQGNTRNHGNLLMFDPSDGDVQVMEAEGENAYSPLGKLYRRTLALVDLGDGNGYVLDIFRVRGGEVHDYMLHGNLSENYTLSVNGPLAPKRGTLHQFIQQTGELNAEQPISIRFDYSDGLATTTRVVNPQRLTVLAGDAPAMRRAGQAPFVAFRNTGGESAFVMVHDAFRGSGNVLGVSVDSPPSQPMSVVVRIVLTDDREDTFVSTLGDSVVRLLDGTQFQGRMAYIRREGGTVQQARIFDGRSLQTTDGVDIHDTEPLRGNVVETMHRESGDPVDAIIVDADIPHGDRVAGKTIFIDMAGVVTWAYRVVDVRPHGKHTLVEIEHEPGFDRRGNLTKMNYFPGWGIRGYCRFYVPQPGTWTADASDQGQEQEM